MNKMLSQAEHFFEWYRQVYGNHFLLDGQVGLQATKPLPEIQPRVSQPEPLLPTHGTKSSKPDDPLLLSLYEEIHQCQNCLLGRTRLNFVFGSGQSTARVMFIGEAPGKEEDESGLPFVGRAGQLLTLMLQAINLNRDQVYIANLLKCRPPKNRDPLPDEIRACDEHLRRQIGLIQPKLLVALGRISGQALAGQEKPLKELRQNILTFNGVPLVVTYHPAALLRNPHWKAETWQDLKRIRKILTTV
jgi:DNA polymerase